MAALTRRRERPDVPGCDRCRAPGVACRATGGAAGYLNGNDNGNSNSNRNSQNTDSTDFAEPTRIGKKRFWLIRVGSVSSVPSVFWLLPLLLWLWAVGCGLGVVGHAFCVVGLRAEES